MKQFNIVPYQARFASQLAQLFHQTVNGIACKYYSTAQIQAWSPRPRSAKYWHQRLSRSQTWVMLDHDLNRKSDLKKCCGFINIETHFYHRGYIDCLYVHPNYQSKTLATKLYKVAESWAKEQQFPELSVDASYLSKALFIKQGFDIQFKTYQPKSGQMIPGFFMKKELS